MVYPLCEQYIITDNRINHIIERRGQEFYDEYTKDLKITVDEDLWSQINFNNSIFTDEDIEDILDGGYGEETTTSEN